MSALESLELVQCIDWGCHMRTLIGWVAQKWWKREILSELSRSGVTYVFATNGSINKDIAKATLGKRCSWVRSHRKTDKCLP